MSEISSEEKWSAMLRGQIISATLNKMMVVMRLADQKAQVLIFMNSILIPVCINEVSNPAFQNAAIISIVTSVLSILTSMICIYPKRKYRNSGHRDINLLHFNDIGHLEKDEYMEMFKPVFNDSEKISEAAIYDIYDLSRYSLRPKFMWLKISYGIFALGNMLAIIFAITEI